jgi:hypothetical protein
MLFHMNSPDEPIHWTEIYVIITVSAALLEDIRKVSIDYFSTRMSVMFAENLAYCRISHTNVGAMAQSGLMDIECLFDTLYSILHRHRTSFWFKGSSRFVHCS